MYQAECRERASTARFTTMNASSLPQATQRRSSTDGGSRRRRSSVEGDSASDAARGAAKAKAKALVKEEVVKRKWPWEPIEELLDELDSLEEIEAIISDPETFMARAKEVVMGAVIAKAFQWVRPMLDPVTMEKVELHAGVPTERFLELMPAAVLPECYGGANAATSYPETGRA